MTTPDGQSGWLCTFYNPNSYGNPDKTVADFAVNDT